MKRRGLCPARLHDKARATASAATERFASQPLQNGDGGADGGFRSRTPMPAPSLGRKDQGRSAGRRLPSNVLAGPCRCPPLSAAPSVGHRSPGTRAGTGRHRPGPGRGSARERPRRPFGQRTLEVRARTRRGGPPVSQWSARQHHRAAFGIEDARIPSWPTCTSLWEQGAPRAQFCVSCRSLHSGMAGPGATQVPARHRRSRAPGRAGWTHLRGRLPQISPAHRGDADRPGGSTVSGPAPRPPERRRWPRRGARCRPR